MLFSSDWSLRVKVGLFQFYGGAFRTMSFIISLLIGVPAASGEVTVPEPEAVLRTLRREHPRLMLHEEELQALKERHRTDADLQALIQEVLRRAERTLDDPPLEHRLVGPRLLSVSRECLRRVYALGLAWRWTGDERFARAAIANLLTVTAFPDWNPPHFLDTAEMAHAVGVGYDWLYPVLSEAEREQIRQGLIRLGLEPGLRAYRGEGPSHWWTRTYNNWNQVCNGGLIVGALAIAETDPQYAETIVPSALRSLPTALKEYDPDGAWPEGPGYWHYATRYTAYGIAALESALGTDFGLKSFEGLSQAGYFPLYTTGPTDLFLNYADSGERSSRRPMGCLFWLARAYDNPDFAWAEHAVLDRYSGTPEHVIWYVPRPSAPPTLALDKYFRSSVELALFRSSWDDPQALWVGAKAGYNRVSHSHLDLGNFELDALGERWARDIGADDYNLPGYWNSRRGGQRWSYFRLNSFSHNVPILNGEGQDPEGTSKFLKFQGGGERPHVIIDLTKAYLVGAERIHRGVALVADRRAALIQDEFQFAAPVAVTWGMTTDAEITPRGNVAELTQNGKRLIATILSPTGAEFSQASAEQEPPQRRNEGVSRLLVKLPAQAGTVRIAILLAPVWEGGAVTPESIPVQPLADW
ncbi:MAG: hypothetical protein KatS3mg115_0599 [Candidatus Poribacteria bacterium]|nr:MAG: hypothetical protein KatS3mg115_0599 [Candidatus Poribacteria bacterium]